MTGDIKYCYELIKHYVPYNEQEEVDKIQMLQFLERNDDALLRSNLSAHLTASAIVVNKEMTKVLFAHHNIYNAYGWVGGHNDGDKDFLYVSIKEAKEETGIKDVVPYNEDILMIDSIYVGNHVKNEKIVPDHIHMNVTYLLVADDDQHIEHKPDENSDVKWFDIDTVLQIVDEPRMIPIYKKAFDKIKELKK